VQHDVRVMLTELGTVLTKVAILERSQYL